MSKTKPVERKYIKHSDHAHPQTKAASDKCRRIMVKTGKPWDGTETETLTRGRKATGTRAANKKAEVQAQAVDTLLDETEGSESEPLRNHRGRFTRDTLEQWQTLLDSLDGAQAYLVENGADLLGASITTSIGGQTFIAKFDGHEWSVEVAE